MRPAELCAPEGAPGAGAAHRSTFPKLADAPVALLDQDAVEELDADGDVAAPFRVGPSAARARRFEEVVLAPAAPQVASHGVYLTVKVVVEWLASVVLLVLAAPVIGLLALLVRLTSPGPSFYLQTRLGRNGKAYRICKLRTMEHNCEAKTGPVWAAKDDVRITPLGNLLRKTHLDELPQLWNVVRGEMALIGPRPERPEITARIEHEIPGFRERLAVRPGVTGLAQMLLPADTDLESVRLKLAHDLYYLRHVGVRLDLRIAVCTVFYFLGTAAEAVCRAAVGSYGRAVEGRFQRERAAETA